MEDAIAKAATLLEALPYIQRFRNETFVIKYGGSFMDSPDPEVRSNVARDIVFLEAVGINPVIIHGGGKAITRALEEAGLETRFVQGMRVTDAKTIEMVDRVLTHTINPEIVQMLRSLGGQARGLPGREVFSCEKLWMHGPDGDPVDTGYVGRVTGVETQTLRSCIDEHVTPVISPTACGPEGATYNSNADIAAAQVAIALKAKRLVFMSDVAGLMSDPSDASTVMPHLRVKEVEALKRKGIIDRGMIPKVDSAVAAIQAGVDKVSLVDGRVPHAVMLEIFTDRGVGTEVVL